MHAGMRLGEALARCPQLALVPPDPMGVAERGSGSWRGWSRSAPPSSPSGRGSRASTRAACAGCTAGTSTATLRRDPRAALGAACAVRRGTSRFCALAAAIARGCGGRARRRRRRRARWPASRSSLLRARPVTARAARAARAPGDHDARRGRGARPRAAGRPLRRAGPAAHDLVRGRDAPLARATAGERLAEALELPEAGSGVQLQRALGLLVDRLLARRERRGRTLRAVVLAARARRGRHLARARRVPRGARRSGADAARARPRLGCCPRRPTSLRLARRALRPADGDQRSLLDDSARAVRAARLREAVRQARAAAGPEAALRVLAVDPDSRVPERRHVLDAVRAMSGPRRLGQPRRGGVRADARRPPAVPSTAARSRRSASRGSSRTAGGREQPLRRRYWEVVTADGRDLVVFRELISGGWFSQRG